MPKFVVTIERERTITESVEVTVRAKDPDQAEEEALEQAKKLTDKEWEEIDADTGEPTVADVSEED